MDSFWSFFIVFVSFFDYRISICHDRLLRCCSELLVYCCDVALGFQQDSSSIAVDLFGISMILQTVESLMQDSRGIPLGSLKVFLWRCCGIAAVLL